MGKLDKVNSGTEEVKTVKKLVKIAQFVVKTAKKCEFSCCFCQICVKNPCFLP